MTEGIEIPNTPLLSCRAEEKKVQRDLMVPPNSLGQMLNFGTSLKKRHIDTSAFTPLLSEGAEKKNFPNTLMVPPNSLGQMLKFGTSYEKK